MNVGDDAQKDEDDLTITSDVLGTQDVVVNQVQQQQEQSSSATSDILMEFLEVAIHQILYSRKLYPEEIFLLRKKYNVQVHMASHPGLNDYISAALSSVRPLLKEEEICRISLLVEDKDTPVENFVFEVNLLRNVLSTETEYSELEQLLRSFILKILANGSQMSGLKDTCSFEILVACKTDREADLNIMNDQSDMKWVEVNKSDFSKQLQPDGILPIKALSCSLLNIQLIVEQMQ